MATRVLGIISSRAKTFAVLAILLPAAAAAGSLAGLQRSEATVGLWASAPPATPQVASQVPADAHVDTFRQAARTGSMSDDLSQELGRSHVGGDATDRNHIAAVALSRVTVTAAGTHLVVLSLPCDIPGACVGVLAAIVDSYNEHAQRLQSAQVSQIQLALGSQVDDAQNALLQAENALATFQAQHPASSASAAIKDPELDLLDGQLTAAKQQVLAVQAKLSELQLAAAARAAQGGLTIVDPVHTARRGVLVENVILQASVLAALLVAAALAYLLVLLRLDQTASRPRDLEQRLHLPVLTSIPRYSAMKRY